MKSLWYCLSFCILASCSYVADPVVVSQPKGLIINEVLSSNGRGILDEFGERSDWIELFNAGSDPVNLADYSLSDKSGNRLKWFMGDSVLNPGEYVLVFASGRNIPTPRARNFPITYPIGYVGSWADSEMEGDTGWTSFVKPWKGSSIYEKGVVSATMYLGNNDGKGWIGQTLISIVPAQTINLQGYNQFEFSGYIEKGKTIQIEFPQKTWAEQTKFEQYFSAISIPVTGTGVENDHYSIQINSTKLDSTITMNEIREISISYREYDDSVHLALKDFQFSQTPTAMHSSFSLESDLFLTNKSGKTVDSVSIPSMNPDCSWGRSSSVRSQFGYCRIPSPGKPNGEEQFATVLGSTVRSSLPSGFYRGPVSLELFAANGEDAIHYTTDGSVPTINSPRYRAPIVIAKSSTIRSASFRNGVISESVTTRSFLLEKAPAIPVVCITVDSFAMFDSIKGIHSVGPHAGVEVPQFGANFWDESEIPATIEYFENGNRAFEKNIGISIQGNFSKALPKKSFALTCRREYGSGSFEYPFFPRYPQLRKFNSLILRSGSQHQEGVFFFDAYRAELSSGMGIDYQKYRPALVYINGKYWGIYSLQEKLNEHYLETNYGTNPNTVSLIKEAGVIQSGNADHYIALLEYVRSGKVDTKEAYAYINTQMDILNYSDYFSTIMYLTNSDWPANNIKWWRDRSSNSRWKWMIYDTDGAEDYDFDMLEHVLSDTLKMGSFPNGTTFSLLFRSLLKNEQFRSDFINRTAVFLNTQFLPSRTTEVLDRMTAEALPYWDRDSERWDFSISSRKYWLDRMRLFCDKRPDAMREHFVKKFKLGSVVRGTVSSDRGTVIINGLAVGSSISGSWFEKSPLRISLSDSTGFVRWSDGITTASRTATLENGGRVHAEFR